MKHLITFVAISLMLFSLQSCSDRKENAKQITDALIAIFGIDKICFTEPVKSTFDPNKPNEVQVQVTLSNSNNYDVVSTGSLSLQILLRDKDNNIIGGASQPYQIPNPTIFPKNQVNAFTSPPIRVASYIPLKKGETYTVELQKSVSGTLYSVSNLPPYNSSCYYFKHTITIP